jgi:septal ring factor EnvC (AmiA/AmiB activator)
MSKVDLSKVNAALKSRTKRTHQNVPRVPKELHELKQATRELQSQVRQLEGQAAELKRQTAELRASRPVSVAKPAPAKKEVASNGREVTCLVVPRKESKQ